MYGKGGNETEDTAKVTYLKPTPICGRCKSFGHVATACRFEEVGSEKDKTGVDETEKIIRDKNAMMDGVSTSQGTKINEDNGTRGSDLNDMDVQAKENATTGNEVDIGQTIQQLQHEIIKDLVNVISGGLQVTFTKPN